jgi:hypothetical protein
LLFCVVNSKASMSPEPATLASKFAVFPLNFMSPEPDKLASIVSESRGRVISPEPAKDTLKLVDLIVKSATISPEPAKLTAEISFTGTIISIFFPLDGLRLYPFSVFILRSEPSVSMIYLHFPLLM